MKKSFFLILLILILLFLPIYATPKTDKTLFSAFSDSNKVEVVVFMKPDKELEVPTTYHFSSTNAFVTKVNYDEFNALQSNPDVIQIFNPKKHIFSKTLQDSITITNTSLVHSTIFNSKNITGKNQVICIVDSGINYHHSDFWGNYTFELINETINITNTSSGYFYFNRTLSYNVFFLNITNLTKDEAYEIEFSIDNSSWFNESEKWWPPYTNYSILYYRINISSFQDNSTMNISGISALEEIDKKIISGYDFFNNDSDAIDDEGHGTHVAGIVGAKDGIIGIAPDAKLIITKVLNSTGDSDSSVPIAQGIEFCVNESIEKNLNMSAISISIGTQGYHNNSYCDSDFPLLTTQIDYAYKNNISVVIATGNEFVYSGISGPACIQNSTRVTATTKNLDYVVYANRGGVFDIYAAPGYEINSTCLNQKYCIKSGTSMATPHISAMIALLLQAQKERNYEKLTPDEIKTRINKTGIDIYDSQTNLSYKFVDIYSAIEIDKTAPEINNYTINETLVPFGSAFEISTNWTESTLNESNLTCKLYINANLTQEINSTESWCNFTYQTTLSEYPNVSVYVTATDYYNNTGTSDTQTINVDLYCDANLNQSITMVRDLMCNGNALHLAEENITLNCNNNTINGTIFMEKDGTTIEFCNISCNAGYGIHANNINNLSILSNILFNSSTYSGIKITNTNNSIINGNLISESQYGIEISGNNNTIENNTLYKNTYGVSISSGFNNNLLNNNFTLNNYALNSSALNTTWYINSIAYLFKNNVTIENGSLIFQNNSILNSINSTINISGVEIKNTGQIKNIEIKIQNISQNTTTAINFSQINVELLFYVKNNLTATIIVCEELNETQVSGKNILKAIDICLDNNTESNLSWIQLKMYYNDSYLIQKNIREPDLTLYRYDEINKSWKQETDERPYTSDNYMWAMLNHTGLFGAFGEPIPEEEEEDMPKEEETSDIGLTSSEKIYSKILESVEKEKEYSFKINKSEIPIYYLRFISKSNANTAKVKIKTLNSNPVKKKVGNKVLEYVEIYVTNIKVADTHIKFKVKSQWINRYNTTYKDIRLFRYVNETWTELDTRLIKTNKKSTYTEYSYEAISPGLSYFAVSFINKTEIISENKINKTLKEEEVDVANLENKKPGFFSRNWKTIVIIFGIILINALAITKIVLTYINEKKANSIKIYYKFLILRLKKAILRIIKIIEKLKFLNK